MDPVCRIAMLRRLIAHLQECSGNQQIRFLESIQFALGDEVYLRILDVINNNANPAEECEDCKK